MRERVVLDVLDAEDAVVGESGRRGAEQAEDVDREDADLVLVLASQQDVFENDEGALEVRSVVCDSESET